MTFKIHRRRDDGFVVGYNVLLEDHPDYLTETLEDGVNPHLPKFLSDSDKASAPASDETLFVPEVNPVDAARAAAEAEALAAAEAANKLLKVNLGKAAKQGA